MTKNEDHSENNGSCLGKIILAGMVIILIAAVLFLYSEFISTKEVIENELIRHEKKITHVSSKVETKVDQIDQFVDSVESSVDRIENLVLARMLNEKVQQTGLPLAAKVKRVKVVGSDVERIVNLVAWNLAFPLFQKGIFFGVLSLPEHPLEQRGGTGVYGRLHFEFDDEEIKQVRKEISIYLIERISENDWVIDIEWTVLSGGGIFDTKALMYEGGQMKFESILFFISTSPEAALPRQKQPQYLVVPWAGKIKNGLGLTAITWDAKISYSYHDGRIIGNPARQFSHHSKLPLWWVITEQTGIELGQCIGPGTGGQPFEALPAFFRLAWSSGFQKPLKVNTRYLSAELPDLNTGVNRLERVYEIRGNGTYVRLMD